MGLTTIGCICKLRRGSVKGGIVVLSRGIVVLLWRVVEPGLVVIGREGAIVSLRGVVYISEGHCISEGNCCISESGCCIFEGDWLDPGTLDLSASDTASADSAPLSAS